ncbi:unnamed protein product, partial [marine sediment metagenome]
DRLQRVLGNAKLAKRSKEVAERIDQLTHQINTLLRIQNLFAIKRYELQKLLAESQLGKDHYEAMITIRDMFRDRQDIKDEKIIHHVVLDVYKLSLDLIRRCLKSGKDYTFTVHKAIETAIDTRRYLSTDFNYKNNDSKAETLSEILSDIFCETAYPRPNISKERWKNILVEAIKAIIYGIAASSVYQMLYHMYSSQNPTAMQDAYNKIYRKSFNEVKKRGIYDQLTRITGDEKDTDTLTSLLFGITFNH